MLDLQTTTGETLDQLVDSFLEHDRAAYALVLSNNMAQAATSSELEDVRALEAALVEARRSTMDADADVVKRKKLQKGAATRGGGRSRSRDSPRASTRGRSRGRRVKYIRAQSSKSTAMRRRRRLSSTYHGW